MVFFKHTRRSIALAAAFLLSSTVCIAAEAQQASASGEVRRVDLQAGKVAIKQGAIAALELPPMVLVYHADPALLRGLAPGDKVRFTAKRDHGEYVIVNISK